MATQYQHPATVDFQNTGLQMLGYSARDGSPMIIDVPAHLVATKSKFDTALNRANSYRGESDPSTVAAQEIGHYNVCALDNIVKRNAPTTIEASFSRLIVRVLDSAGGSGSSSENAAKYFDVREAEVAALCPEQPGQTSHSRQYEIRMAQALLDSAVIGFVALAGDRTTPMSMAGAIGIPEWLKSPEVRASLDLRMMDLERMDRWEADPKGATPDRTNSILASMDNVAVSKDTPSGGR